MIHFNLDIDNTLIFSTSARPFLHRRVAEAAARSGKSLNRFIKETLEHAT